MEKQLELSFEPTRIEIPELNTIRDIAIALERQDENLLWQAARGRGSLAAFYEQLRAQVGFAEVPGDVHRIREIRDCAALVAVPILLTAADAALVSSHATVSPSIGRAIAWLQEWFQYRVHIRLFSCLFSYAEICMWSPCVTRTRLLKLVDAHQNANAVAAVDFGLPVDAPVLAFMIAAAYRPLNPPALPHLDPEGDLQLLARISGLLQFCGAGSEIKPVTVLIPGFLSDAVAAGVDAFLVAIASRYGIIQWGVEARGLDMVVVHIEIADHPGRTVAIPLRAHQLGIDGVERCLQRLESLAAKGHSVFKPSRPH